MKMSYISKDSLVLREKNKRFGWDEVKINKGDEFKVIDIKMTPNEKIYDIEFKGENFDINWLDVEHLIQGNKVDLNKCIRIN